MVISAEIVMVVYKHTQNTEIMHVYDEIQRNARMVARVYSERFPRDRHLTHQTITDVLHSLREAGSMAVLHIDPEQNIGQGLSDVKGEEKPSFLVKFWR